MTISNNHRQPTPVYKSVRLILILSPFMVIIFTCSLPTIVPVEEIHSLAPQQTAKMVLEVHFHHHLLPLKLSVLCNGKTHPAKLHPDIAYFVRPLPMDLNAFLCKENQLRGMFEYARRSVKFHLVYMELGSLRSVTCAETNLMNLQQVHIQISS